MAQYVSLKYQTNLELPDLSTEIIGRIRVLSQVTSLVVGSVTNTEPAGDQNSVFPIRQYHIKRFGIAARYITIYRLQGDSPNQFREYRRIPILDPNLYIAAISQIAATISYEGQTDWIMVGGTPERARLAYGRST
jgi:hypothetical protein